MGERHFLRERPGWDLSHPGRSRKKMTLTRVLPLAPFQFNHRNFARSIFLVLAELRVHFSPLRVDAVALLTCYGGSDSIVGLVSHFDGNFGMSKQIVVPVGIGWRASFGGEDE